MSHFNLKDIFSATLVLFAVIDILGSIPIIVGLKQRGGEIKAMKATIVALVVMVVFTFFGEVFLNFFGVDLSSFAIAGAFVLFIMGAEMVLGIEIMKYDSPSGVSIVPIAFPLIAGAGSFTTVLALRAEYDVQNIIVAIIINMIVVYIVIRSTSIIEWILGDNGIHILRKVFGIILLAISVKLFMKNVAIQLHELFPGLKTITG